jgi:uncharacterized protein (TIRG00374 family)
MQISRSIKWFLRSAEPQAQRARQITRIIIVLGLFIILFWIIPLGKVIQAIRATDARLFAIGFVFGLVTVFLTSLQMLPLTRKQGINRNVFQIFAINLSVKFYLMLTPTTLVGSGVRWYRLAQPEGKVVEAFVALAFFRLFETFLTLVMGLGFLLLSVQGAIQVSIGWIILLILTIVFIWVLITRLSLPIYRWLRVRAGTLTDRPYLQPVLDSLEKVLSTASSYADMPARGLFLMIGSGILSALAGITSGLFLAEAVGINLNFLEMGWIQAAVSLASQLPFTVGEGLGVREVTLVAVLSLFGINAANALAFSFLIFIRSALIALVGGILEAIQALRTRRVARPAMISRNTNDP